MIIAAAPGGNLNVLTKFTNGDVTLSVSLTAIISLVSIAVPFIVFKSTDLLQVNYSTKEISMIGISIKCFGCNLTCNYWYGNRKFATIFISSNEKLIQRISLYYLLLFFGNLDWEWENITTYLKQAGIITLILNIVMMTIGYFIAKLFASGIEQRRCISLECGLQNGTLAVFVASQIFNDVIYLVPTASYALIMFITSIFFVLFIRNKN